MNLFVPDDYKLIAKTEMPGIIVKCYYNSNTKEFFFNIEYLSYNGTEVKQKWMSFGPMTKQVLNPLIHVMTDVVEMTIPIYIKDDLC